MIPQLLTESIRLRSSYRKCPGGKNSGPPQRSAPGGEAPELGGRAQLPSLAPQIRLLPQRGAPMGPGEVRRIERWLATARLTLAISALFAIWMDPSQISWWAYWLLGIYIIHGTVVMLLLRFRKHSTPAFRSLVHAVDLVWPALISVFAIGARHPFFLFFVFVLAAAAYRWGLWETVGTAAASVILLWLGSVAAHQGFLASVEDFLLRHHWPALGIDVVELEPKHLFMHSVYLLVMGWLLGYLAEQQKRLRAEVERARLAEALHDGALQSMIAAAMHLEAVRKQSALQVVTVAQELGRIEDFLREEALKLRELMQQMKPLDVDAKNLRAHLMELVERFQSEPGIAARFDCESPVAYIKPGVCDAVARIVQEGLWNVRKHSGARHVLVQLDRTDGHQRLTIEDDGRGFPFSGRFCLAELEAEGKGPLVIRECVRSINGDLTIESTPGWGSRLEITIPQTAATWILSHLIR
jgi:signal transduction histidine kinase